MPDVWCFECHLAIDEKGFNNHSVNRPCSFVNMKISLQLLLPRYMYLYHHIFNVCVLIDFIVLCKLLTTFLVSLFSVLMLLLMHICGQTV